MRFPWQPREYTRTCSNCGCTWQVPRLARKRRIRSISSFQVARGPWSVDRGELTREIQSIAADKQAVEAVQHCPDCGADQFTQHAVRRRDRSAR